MSSPRVARVTLAVAVVVSGFGVVAQAHQDDPKARCNKPIYLGPGYRRDVDGAAAAGAYPALNVTLLANITIPEFSGGGSGPANDCWGYVSPSGTEYAIIGLECGTGFVNLSEPGNPQVIEVSHGSDVVPGPCCVWRDVKTYMEHAYIVSECGLGIQVVDLSAIDQGIIDHIGNVDGGVGSASHNVALDEASGYLYRCGGSSYGMSIYSLANPAAPAYVATWDDRYIHDLQVITFTEGPNAGREIAFAFGGMNSGWVNTSLSVVDVTDKQNLAYRGELVYPNGEYSHQGWLSADGQTVYLGDELDEGTLGIPSTTHVIDVSHLDNPTWLGEFDNGNAAVTHNLYVRGSFIYEANYTSGLRVFDTSTDEVHPAEVAYFDTRPEDDVVDYAGAWSNYPLLPSGLVLISDRQRGLFVVDVEGDDVATCLGDIDGNGSIGFTDLLDILSNWGPCAACPQDIDGSGDVGFSDVLYILSNWGPCAS